MSLQRRFLGVACLLFSGVSLCAQQQSTIAKVQFRNSGGFAQADLETVAGIHPGSRVSLAGMQTAAQHLADTGFFDDVRLESSGTPEALTLIFLLKPSAGQPLYRVFYENFAWFTPAELRAVVHGVAPLLSDQLPENDATLDAVGKALEDALRAKGYAQVQVQHELIPPSVSVPESLIRFRAEQPEVRVAAVALQGTPAAFAEQVSKEEAQLRGTLYVAGSLPYSTMGALLSPLWNAGYLEASVPDARTTVSAPGVTPVQVQLAGTVDPGAPYHVGGIGYTPTELAPASMFAAGQKLHEGDLASPKALYATEAPLEAAYRKQGYMYAYIDPGTVLDAKTHMVRYALHVVPGERYTVRNVTVEGLPPQDKAVFDQAWTVKAGDPYNAAYVSNFLTNNTAIKQLQGYAGTFQASTDVEKHQVDVAIRFLRTGGGR